MLLYLSHIHTLNMIFKCCCDCIHQIVTFAIVVLVSSTHDQLLDAECNWFEFELVPPDQAWFGYLLFDQRHQSAHVELGVLGLDVQHDECLFNLFFFLGFVVFFRRCFSWDFNRFIIIAKQIDFFFNFFILFIFDFRFFVIL